jgi:hypothetical protein
MRPLLWVPAFEQIGKGLHRAYDEILEEPLPQRWGDLIQRLNAEEAAEKQSWGQAEERAES